MKLQHLDANGVELAVGDDVRYGLREGTILILEDWGVASLYHPREGVYVSDIGYWGDARAVPAQSVVKL
jgi:hypothetical protein